MQIIRILQLGDIHYPELHSSAAVVDAVDQQFPSSLKSQVASSKYSAVMREAATRERDADALVFCGDLTTSGHIGSYRDCVTNLVNLFGLKNVPAGHSSVHAVPGNHDVDWNLAGDESGKFDPLREAWAKLGVPILEPMNLRATSPSQDKPNVKLLSLNSCIACGERRYSALDQDALAELRELVGLISNPMDDVREEMLDAPMFRHSDIEAVVSMINGLPRTVLPVVIAHHNLLPQSQPRLHVYSELVNAGAFRAALASCMRVSIYLHGHIHADPIEIVEQLKPEGGRTIAISAPRIDEGFNEIAIAFGKHGYPLGCTVTPIRCNEAGLVRAMASVHIPLRARDSPMDSKVEEVIAGLSPGPQWFSNFVESDPVPRLSEQEIANALLEGYWAGQVGIDQPDRVPQEWQIERRLP